jgi:hypothetical protein
MSEVAMNWLLVKADLTDVGWLRSEEIGLSGGSQVSMSGHV